MGANPWPHHPEGGEMGEGLKPSPRIEDLPPLLGIPSPPVLGELTSPPRIEGLPGNKAVKYHTR